MKKNIQIAISKPCHEKWNSFTQTSKGGFCSSCQKEVVDFTSWSDEQLKLYFKNLPINICGQFRQDQLKVYSYDDVNRTRTSWVSFLFAGCLLFLSSRQVSAQSRFQQTTEHYQYEDGNKRILRSKPAKVTVIGTVTSRENNRPLEGVKVMLKGPSDETITDAAGKFSLDLANKDSSQLIVFSLNGFKTREYVHNASRPGREIAVEMTPGDLGNIQNMLSGVLGGAVATTYVKRKGVPGDMWWWLTRR